MVKDPIYINGWSAFWADPDIISKLYQNLHKNHVIFANYQVTPGAPQTIQNTNNHNHTKIYLLTTYESFNIFIA